LALPTGFLLFDRHSDFHVVAWAIMRLYARHPIDIRWSDLGFALRSLATPASGAALRVIAGCWPPGRHAVPCLSVRTAFDALLTELRLPTGSEIVMSAITIAGMQDIARHHGLVIRAVDVDPGTLAPSRDAISAAISDRTRVILIAHLFGSRVDLAPLAHLRSPQILLVEDCAQSWTPAFQGSQEADVSLFSFGPIKTLTALGGAVAAFRDADLAHRFATRVESYPELSRWWYAKRIAKYAALKFASGPLPYGFICRMVTACGGDVDRAISGLTRGFGQTPALDRFQRKPPDAMVGLMARRLAAPSDLSPRRAAGMALTDDLPVDQAPGSQSIDFTFWVTPVLVDNPAAMRAELMARGFDATCGTTSMRVIGDAPERTAAATEMMQRILYLPSPVHLPQRKLQELRGLLGLIPLRERPGSSPP
jgi:perosamine synthetase